jgi:hypothetical protein
MPEKIIKATPPENDPVKHPNHYCYGKFECVEVIQELTAGASGPEGFLLGNVIKYLWRYRRKNGAEDLRKARRYIDMLLRFYEEMEGANVTTAIFDAFPGIITQENGRPVFNRAVAEGAARYTGQQGEFFDAVNGKRTPGRLGSINPDSPAPFTGLVCTGKDKYITMPYKFFSPLPENGADENPQEKPEA